MSRSANGLLEKLNRQSKEIDNIYYSLAAALGLSENTFWVLYILSDTSRQYSQQAICDEWSFSRQTVNSTVSGLIEKGYVYLEQAPSSKRQKFIKLTEKGMQFVKEQILPIRKAEEKAVLHMTEQEWVSYLEISQKHIVCLREEMGGIYVLSIIKRL